MSVCRFGVCILSELFFFFEELAVVLRWDIFGIKPWLVPTQLNDNGFAACLLQSAQRTVLRLDGFSLEVAGCSRRTSVDTADLCYSKWNIWPCLFSEIDPTLCFKFIFIYRGKYVSANPACTSYTDSSPNYTTEEQWPCVRHYYT